MYTHMGPCPGKFPATLLHRGPEIERFGWLCCPRVGVPKIPDWLAVLPDLLSDQQVHYWEQLFLVSVPTNHFTIQRVSWDSLPTAFHCLLTKSQMGCNLPDALKVILRIHDWNVWNNISKVTMWRKREKRRDCLINCWAGFQMEKVSS